MVELNVAAQPQVNRERCTACGACVTACHANALAFSGPAPMVVAIERCDYCGRCEAVCPTGAIRCPYEISYRHGRERNSMSKEEAE